MSMEATRAAVVPGLLQLLSRMWRVFQQFVAAAFAGIFEEAPPEERAVATTAGLVINCANSALYMAVSIRSSGLHMKSGSEWLMRIDVAIPADGAIRAQVACLAPFVEAFTATQLYGKSTN